MRVFIAGATGTLGLPLVQRLVAGGHEVIGLTRKERGRDALRLLGAKGVVGNALDPDGLRRIVVDAAPTHVVHLLTALPKEGVLRPADLDATNELRIHGTANLLAAAIAAGAQRIVAESFPTVYGVGDVSASPLREDDALAQLPDDASRPMVEALRSLESQVLAANDRIEAIVLRYGLFYGESVPSTVSMAESLRARKMPLMRGANGIASFVHVEDAASATIAALERGVPGSVYNIVDDQPVGLKEFVTSMAESIGAPPPRTLPRFLVRVAAPMAALFSITRLPLSNAKAKRELRFQPKFASVREGLKAIA